MLLTVPASRYEQVQVVIGMRWTIAPGVKFYSVQIEQDAIAETPTVPHHDAVKLDEEHGEAYGGKKDEQHRVEEAEAKREYVLVEDGGDEEYSAG